MTKTNIAPIFYPNGIVKWPLNPKPVCRDQKVVERKKAEREEKNIMIFGPIINISLTQVN